MRTAAAPGSPFDGSFEFQVVKMLVEWRAPARFDDVLEISVRATQLGTSSFTLGFAFRKLGSSDVIVTGETVNVHVHGDGKGWAKRPLPDDMRGRLLRNANGKVVDQSGR